MASKPSNSSGASRDSGREPGRSRSRTTIAKPKLVARQAEEYAWLPWAVWAGGTLLLILLSASHQDLLLNDSTRAFERAQALWEHPGLLRNWVHEYYPVGYPWLVGLLTNVFGNAFTAGRILSVASASGTLLLIFLIIRQQATGRYQALITAGVMVTAIANFNFLQLGTFDNTDFPAAALMLASLYWLGSPPTQSPSGRGLLLSQIAGSKYSRYLIAGLWLGAAYLIRYTALTQVPSMLAAIYFFNNVDKPRRFKACVAFLGGFAALGLVQFIPSALLFGNPFYNLQAHNVWFALHGEGNWGQHFTEAVKHTSLVEIARNSPGLFIKNYVLNLYKLLCYNVFDLPVFWLWLPGIVIAWMAKDKTAKAGLKPSLPVAGLSFTVLLFGAALCLAFVTPRTTLFLFPVLCILAGWALSAFAERKAVSLAILASLSLLSLGELYSTKDFIAPAFRHTTQASAQEAVTSALEKAGMTSSKQVLSLGFTWYNAHHPYRIGYAIPWSFYGDGQPINTAKELEELVRRKGYRFIISDKTSLIDVPGLKRFWPSIPTNLRPDTVFIENEVCVIALCY